MEALETPAARSTDPITSFLAADSITTVKISATQRAILHALESGPSTYDQMYLNVLSQGIKVTQQRVRTACVALRDAGFVRDSESDGRSMAGYRAKRWELNRA